MSILAVGRYSKMDVQITLPSIMGKDRCKGEKRNDERKRHAEIHVEKSKVMNIVANF